MSRINLTTKEFNLLNAVRNTLSSARDVEVLDTTRLRLVNAVIKSSEYFIACVLLDAHLSVDANDDFVDASTDPVVDPFEGDNSGNSTGSVTGSSTDGNSNNTGNVTGGVVS